jgi:hypothetical protein
MNKLFLIALANLCLIGSSHLFADDNAKPSVAVTIDATQLEHGDHNIWLTSIGNGKAMDDTKLPAAAEFDYVRFFEKTAE